VGVAWTGNDASFQAFVDKHGLTFAQINDERGVVFDRFGVAFQPAIVIVKADGSTETIAGAVGEELLDQIVREAG
jgi:peroxiredoxin